MKIHQNINIAHNNIWLLLANSFEELLYFTKRFLLAKKFMNNLKIRRYFYLCYNILCLIILDTIKFKPQPNFTSSILCINKLFYY